MKKGDVLWGRENADKDVDVISPEGGGEPLVMGEAHRKQTDNVESKGETKNLTECIYYSVHAGLTIRCALACSMGFPHR